MLHLGVQHPFDLSQPDSCDDKVLLDVGGGLFEGPEPVGPRPRGIALAQAVGAVIENPTPPTVNLDLV